MANKNAAFGLRPLAKLGANYNSGGFTTYAVKSGNNSGNIFQGAVVKLGSDGYVVVAGNSDTQILGVAGGIEYTAADGSPTFQNYFPDTTATLGSQDIKIRVYDDPNQLFLIQADGTSAQTSIGMNADVAGNANGNTTNGISSGELDSSTLNTTQLMLRVVGVDADPDNNDLASDNANLIVKINDHFYAPNTVGV
jgi:hypothetical protein|tara:strand:+ start:27 stop:611 length:585 start_codon:yes stop_codon:yes gene_type:complete